MSHRLAWAVGSAAVTAAAFILAWAVGAIPIEQAVGEGLVLTLFLGWEGWLLGQQFRGPRLT